MHFTMSGNIVGLPDYIMRASGNQAIPGYDTSSERRLPGADPFTGFDDRQTHILFINFSQHSGYNNKKTRDTKQFLAKTARALIYLI